MGTHPCFALQVYHLNLKTLNGLSKEIDETMMKDNVFKLITSHI